MSYPEEEEEEDASPSAPLPPLLVAMEYLELGDLCQFLRRSAAASGRGGGKDSGVIKVLTNLFISEIVRLYIYEDNLITILFLKKPCLLFKVYFEKTLLLSYP